MLCGGVNPTVKPADETVQKLVDQLSGEIKSRSGNKEFPHLKAVHYKTQVVAGTNYFVKVDAGDEHLHLRIFSPLPCNSDKPELSAIQHNKKLEDALEYFS